MRERRCRKQFLKLRNEWTETSYLQPDNVYGYGYLEAVKKVFVDGE